MSDKDAERGMDIEAAEIALERARREGTVSLEALKATIADRHGREREKK